METLNKNVNWKKIIIGEGKILKSLSENKKTFKQSLLENLKWILFIEILHWLDVLVLTRVALNHGFTEKGILTAKLMEINYWLGGIFSIITFLCLILLFVFMKWRFAIIMTFFVMFITVISNWTILDLFYQGRIIPF